MHPPYLNGMSDACIFNFQNLHLTLLAIFFILTIASHLQQNKQYLSTNVVSNLAVPMVSETRGYHAYCFFVWHLMLYFAEANIIIKGEKITCR